MVRDFDKRRYWMAAVFTFVIFAFGLSVGMVAEQQRTKYVDAMYTAQSSEYESLQLQYAYLTSLSTAKESCPALQYSLNIYMKHLEDTRIRLENYQETSSSINKDGFDSLKRQYIIAEVKAWMFTRKLKEACNDTEIVTVLNFHSKDCERCEDEGMVLSYFKDVFKEKVLIFSFDADYEKEPLVAMLKSTYDVTMYPTLIVENQKYAGFIASEDLGKVLCANYKNESYCSSE
jgi:hypothetical protein